MYVVLGAIIIFQQIMNVYLVLLLLKAKAGRSEPAREEKPKPKHMFGGQPYGIVAPPPAPLMDEETKQQLQQTARQQLEKMTRLRK